MIERETGRRFRSNEIKKLSLTDIEGILGQEDLVLSATVSRAAIDFFGHHIKQIQRAVKSKIKIRKPFQYLLTVPGIGEILGLTIMLEVGDIRRFAKVSNFSSYARCVSAKRFSADKGTGKGNRKNGNRYLSWAFVEACHFARRDSAAIRRYYQRKASRTNQIVATKAVSNKLARASYYVMRDQVPFREERLFCKDGWNGEPMEGVGS
jgi:transposase